MLGTFVLCKPSVSIMEFCGAQPLIMYKKIKSYLRSLVSYSKAAMTVPLLVLLPLTPLHITSMSSLFGPMIYTTQEVEETITVDYALRELRAKKIDAYFAQHNLPLSGFGMKFVVEAEKYNLPWNLTASIAMRESTGGKFMFAKNNPFGWGKKVEFKTLDEAIEVISWNLGGYNPKTAKYYEDKNVKEILKTYNPPSVVYNYSDQVMDIMKKIDNTKVKNSLLAVEI